MLFLNIHTHKSTHNVCEIVSLSTKESSNKYFSIGIHPWFVSEENLQSELYIVNEKALDKKCLAIGECGLDTICKTDYTLQKKAFQAQIQVAITHQKPLIIHNVRSHQDIQHLLKKNNFEQIAIFHGFVYKETVAHFLLQQKNNFLSFGKALLHNASVQRTFQSIPNHRFFLETDDADISIQEIYEKACELKQVTLQNLSEMQQETFGTVFGVFPKNM